MLRRLSLYALVLTLAGCSTPASDPARGVSDIYQRTRHDLTLPPQAAAECVSRNARGLGYAADLSPLYGTEVMAVTAKTLPAGGVDVAVIQLLPESTGSRALVTVTTERLHEGPDVIRSLLAGC